MVEIREDFCGMCMAVPIALAGAGIAGLSTREEYKKRKFSNYSACNLAIVLKANKMFCPFLMQVSVTDRMMA